MTSNLGSHIIQEKFDNVAELDYPRVAEQAKVEVMELLKATIRPEFLNRIDETIMFNPLSKGNVRQILRIQLNGLKEMLTEQGINLVIPDEAFNWLAETGYDPFFGARPIKRVIQRTVLNELSKALLGGTIDKTHNVVMDIFDGKIVFRKPINELEEV